MSGYLPCRQSDQVCVCFFSVLFLGAFDTRKYDNRKYQWKTASCPARGFYGVCLYPAACRASTRLCHASFACQVFVWRARSPHPLPCRACGVGPRWTLQSPKRSQQQQRWCKKVIDNTHCCHSKTVHALLAGGQQDVSRWLAVSSSSSSSQAGIGVVVGCDRVFCGVVRDAVALPIGLHRNWPSRDAQGWLWLFPHPSVCVHTTSSAKTSVLHQHILFVRFQSRIPPQSMYAVKKRVLHRVVLLYVATQRQHKDAS